MKTILLHTGPLGVNTYIILNEQTREAVILDPGGDAARILKTIAAAGARPVAALLTHAHFDHAGACKDLQDAGVPVYAHEEETENLSGAGNMGQYAGFPMKPLHADHTLKDGEIVTLAHLAFRVLHTPGHTKGSCCYLVEGKLFTGDTLFFESVGRTDFIGGDARALSASLKKLMALEGDYPVYAGHGEETSLAYERENNPFC